MSVEIFERFLIMGIGYHSVDADCYIAILLDNSFDKMGNITHFQLDKIDQGLTVSKFFQSKDAKSAKVIFCDGSEKNFGPIVVNDEDWEFSFNGDIPFSCVGNPPTKTVVGVYGSFDPDNENRIGSFGLLYLRKPCTCQLVNVIFSDKPDPKIPLPVFAATYDNTSDSNLDIKVTIKVTKSFKEEWSISKGWTLGGEVDVDAKVSPFKSKIP